MPKRGLWRASDFGQHLKECPAADKAIDNLTTENCPRPKLILLLRSACHPDRKRIFNDLVRKVIPRKQRAREIAKLLDRSATELRFFACSPLGAATLASYEVAVRMFCEDPMSLANALPGHSDLGNPRLLADAMQRQAQTLRNWANSPLGGMASRAFSFRDLWKHLPMAVLAKVIRLRNGQVPWTDLALALEAVAAGYGEQVEVSSEARRKEHERFVKSAAGKRADASGLTRLLLSVYLNPSSS